MSGDGLGRVSAPDFWGWAYADFLSNTLRGVLAEYIVALAAGCADRARTEWDAYDLLTERGLKIEVKSAAYLQTWAQRRPSPIRFDIAERQADSSVDGADPGVTRWADLYVFCVFATQERTAADPLDLAQWFFLACPTPLLAAHFGTQKSARLSVLEALGLPRLDFAALRDTLQQKSGQLPPGTSRLDASRS